LKVFPLRSEAETANNSREKHPGVQLHTDLDSNVASREEHDLGVLGFRVSDSSCRVYGSGLSVQSPQRGSGLSLKKRFRVES